jgi:hypothetical protein
MFSPKAMPPLHPGGVSSAGRPPVTPSPARTPRRKSKRGSSCDAARSPTNHEHDEPLSFSKQASPRRLSIFGKKEEEDDASQADINLLKSPRLEQDILKKNRKIFSPVKTVKRLSLNLSKTLNSSFSSIHKDNQIYNGSSSDDGSDCSDDSFGSDGSKRTRLSENDVALLLCREFSLMDDENDE